MWIDHGALLIIILLVPVCPKNLLQCTYRGLFQLYGLCTPGPLIVIVRKIPGDPWVIRFQSTIPAAFPGLLYSPTPTGKPFSLNSGDEYLCSRFQSSSARAA